MRGYKEISGEVTILKTAEFQCVTETVLASTGVLDEKSGRKVVKGGTAWPANDTTIKGVLLYDIDVTDGDAIAPVLIEGVVYGERLPEPITNPEKVPNIIIH